jgi:hypothetical protein
MCNKLHSDSVPIPETGFGWKLLPTRSDGRYEAYYHQYNYRGIVYRMVSDGWINWWPSLAQDDNYKGFAFFPDYKDIKREYRQICLRKIEYRSGLGKHREEGMHDCIIALCKSFRVVEEV